MSLDPTPTDNGRTVLVTEAGLTITESDPWSPVLVEAALTGDERRSLAMALYDYSTDPAEVLRGEPWLVLCQGITWAGLRTQGEQDEQGVWSLLRLSGKHPNRKLQVDDGIRLITRLIRPVMNTGTPRPKSVLPGSVWLADAPWFTNEDSRPALAVRNGLGEKPWRVMDLNTTTTVERDDDDVVLVTELLGAW